MSYYDRILESTESIKNQISELPEVAIVLGTGLGNFTTKIDISDKILFKDIPNFPRATVEGHEGVLIYGSIGNKRVIAQSGRFHYYEGYNMKEVTFPIRIFQALGVKTLIIVSAVGGIHEDFKAGDVTVVTDHINLHPENPLRGPNDDRLGVRFPDMVDAYSPTLIDLAHQIAQEQNTQLHESVYGGLPGPNIETKAEYRYLHEIGATVVGMSTVPEVIVARHAEIETCVFTAVTNQCYPISMIKKVTIEEVIANAGASEKKIGPLVLELIKRL